MKAKILFDKILERIDITPEKKESYIEKLAPLLNFEVSDELEGLVTEIAKLQNEKSALANRQIAEQIFQKKKKEIDKAERTKLVEKGFSDTEINEILALNLEERISKIAELIEHKAKQKFALSESERIKQEEELRRQEKERADRLQSQMLEIEKRYKTEMEKERAALRLQYLISSIPKNDTIPPAKANKLIQAEVEEMLKRDNAKLIEVNGTLKVVNAEDETLDVFDDRNVRMTIEDYINKAIKEVRLEPKNAPANTKQTIFLSSKENVQPQNTSNQLFIKQFVTQKEALKNFERR